MGKRQKKIKIINQILVLSVLLCSVVACDMQEYPAPEDSGKTELLIYSGMTMIQPLMEIAALIEAQENCKIKITYGGSGHILKSVKVNRVGDLFFPGDESYISDLQQQGVVTDAVQLGYNQAVLFVQPGNPRQLTSSLQQFCDRNLIVVIGSEQAGSIGRETRRILDWEQNYHCALENALYITTDSKGLSKAIRTNDADLVINWKAVQHLPVNRGLLEEISLPADYALQQPLVMGLLKYSANPQLARKVMILAASETGMAIFRKYGFLD